MEGKNILVSVITITYNHEKFIRDCLEGIVMQKTDFSFELLIHDDASTDNTAKIIKEYEHRFPEIIKPIYQTENQYSKGVSLGKTFLYPRAKGKYIALCEGDDYWTDPLKLQKQVDFLEGNEEYSSSCHETRVIYKNQTKKNRLFSKLEKKDILLDDVLDTRMFHTASLLFRRKIIDKHQMPSNILSGDKAIYILLAIYGPIRYFNDEMCVYRINDGGISTWVTFEMIKKDLNIIPWARNISVNFPVKRFKSFIYRTIAMYPKDITKSQKVKYLFLFFIYSFSYFPDNIKQIFKYLKGK